ncbi:hypothetical protein PSU4_39880 [Pseudonocardia sulfidoxydans NBRC 16205]|uniref:ABC transporter ATP-binding protein n=1 Tax=Pseudonocardia sulfidoxydans NBRC 16205 TaxID=1223511 RepID=A0A511DML3_9PSEU|nr:ATP-binding cassette domain-containing protein [Pseudonocardia sulfidoxydans]GEL25034.1 hypothetical protein PSU4_39880 [Pseudonocardia sulfidoxydans NBRC 16205]
MRTRLVPAVVAVLVLLVVVIGPFVAPWPPGETVGRPFTGASAEHLLGTDKLGRDVLSRLLHGGWRLLLITAAALTCAYAVALPLGLLAGLRRRADGWVMRPVDVLVVLPWFLLLAVLATVAGRGAPALLVAGALATLPWVVRLVRTATVEEASAGYVEAAVARAEPWRRIAWREVVPNIGPVVLADAGMRLTATLSVVTVGGYLGLGLPPDVPDWALAVATNQSGITLQPWAVLAPALMIVALVVSVNLLVDTRDSRAVPAVARLARSGTGTLNGRMGEDDTVVEVNGLTVRGAEGRLLLEGADLALCAGHGLAVVGASGAGKSTLARAIANSLGPGLVATGDVQLRRPGGGPGRVLGWVPQDPALALNPSLRISAQLRDVLRAHRRPADAAAVRAALSGVGLPADREFMRRYPHELSGGQQQRVLVALALVGDPAVLVLDEPTTGLDPAAVTGVLDLLRNLRARGISLIIVTHALPIVLDLVDDVAVLDAGRIISVLPAAPRTGPAVVQEARRSARPSAAPLLTVHELAAGYGQTQVIADVDLSVCAGECLGVVGRSGSGKSTIARCLVGLHAPSRGTVTLDGTALARRAASRSRAQRGAIQFVFQNPARSLNPRRTVGEELRAPVRIFGTAEEPADLLHRVGLGVELLDRRTDRLSGGQQQRVAVARALAARPRLLICDEVTASLDPQSRQVVIDLLDRLCNESGLAILFVSHDVEAVASLTDRILTVTEGRLVTPRLIQPARTR